MHRLNLGASSLFKSNCSAAFCGKHCTPNQIELRFAQWSLCTKISPTTDDEGLIFGFNYQHSNVNPCDFTFSSRVVCRKEAFTIIRTMLARRWLMHISVHSIYGHDLLICLLPAKGILMSLHAFYFSFQILLLSSLVKKRPTRAFAMLSFFFVRPVKCKPWSAYSSSNDAPFF